jgi:hypothetical protein
LDRGDGVNIYDFYITPDEYTRAVENGVKPTLLEVRIRSLGWDKIKAINTKPHTKQSLKKWVKIAEANGVCYSTLRYRANRLGWDLERAATQPLQDRKAQAKYAYEKSRKYPKEYKDLALKNGIPERTFHRRLESGWGLEEAATKQIMTSSEIGLLTKEKRQKELSSIFVRF